MTRLTAFILISLLAVVAAFAAGPKESPTVSASQAKLRATYREGFKPPAEADQLSKRTEELIRRLNEMTLPKGNQGVNRLAPGQESAKTPAKHPTTQPAVKSAAVSEAGESSGPVTKQTLEKLQQVSSKVAAPLEIAHALQMGGHRDKAIIFYNLALQRSEDDHEKAWLLYQMAHCNLPEKPESARKLFRQVMADHPDTTWASLANVQVKILVDAEKHQYQAFLEQLKQETREWTGPQAVAGRAGS